MPPSSSFSLHAPLPHLLTPQNLALLRAPLDRSSLEQTPPPSLRPLPLLPAAGLSQRADPRRLAAEGVQTAGEAGALLQARHAHPHSVGHRRDGQVLCDVPQPNADLDSPHAVRTARGHDTRESQELQRVCNGEVVGGVHRPANNAPLHTRCPGGNPLPANRQP